MLGEPWTVAARVSAASAVAVPVRMKSRIRLKTSTPVRIFGSKAAIFTAFSETVCNNLQGLFPAQRTADPDVFFRDSLQQLACRYSFGTGLKLPENG